MKFTKLVKADFTALTDEDKKIWQEELNLLKECADLLNWHYEQAKDENPDYYEFDETDRMYNRADLETLKDIKTKIETLFTK